MENGDPLTAVTTLSARGFSNFSLTLDLRTVPLHDTKQLRKLDILIYKQS